MTERNHRKTLDWRPLDAERAEIFSADGVTSALSSEQTFILYAQMHTYHALAAERPADLAHLKQEALSRHA
jgi:hypothetical protein